MSCTDGYSMKNIPGCPTYSPTAVVNPITLEVVSTQDPTRVGTAITPIVNPIYDEKSAQIVHYLILKHGQDVVNQFENCIYITDYFFECRKAIDFLQLALQAENIPIPIELTLKAKKYYIKLKKYEAIKLELLSKYSDLVTHPLFKGISSDKKLANLQYIKDVTFYKDLMASSHRSIANMPVSRLSKFL